MTELSPGNETLTLETMRPVYRRTFRAREGQVGLRIPVRSPSGRPVRLTNARLCLLAGRQRQEDEAVRVPGQVDDCWRNIEVVFDAADEGTSLFELWVNCARAEGGPVEDHRVAVVQLVAEPSPKTCEVEVEYQTKVVSADALVGPVGVEWETALPITAPAVVPVKETLILWLKVTALDESGRSPRLRGVELLGSDQAVAVVSQGLVTTEDNSDIWQVRLSVLAPEPGSVPRSELQLRICSGRPVVASPILGLIVVPGDFADLRWEVKSPTIAGEEELSDRRAYLGHVWPGSRRAIKLRLANRGTIPLRYEIHRGGQSVGLEGFLAGGAQTQVAVNLAVASPGKTELPLQIVWSPRTGVRNRRTEVVPVVGDALPAGFRVCGLRDRLAVGLVDYVVGLAGAALLLGIWHALVPEYGTGWAFMPMATAVSLLHSMPPIVGSWLAVGLVVDEVTIVLLLLSRGRTVGMVFRRVYPLDARYGLSLTVGAQWLRRAEPWARDRPEPTGGSEPDSGRQAEQEVPFRLRKSLQRRRLIGTLLQVVLLGGVLGLLTVPWHGERASLQDLLTGVRLLVDGAGRSGGRS
ncbi:MAG: hypothetical protein KKI08_22500 [Armatimonadetes bacterium]|nr:hypothetical protein [Armatimonadota bacterium]